MSSSSSTSALASGPGRHWSKAGRRCQSPGNSVALASNIEQRWSSPPRSDALVLDDAGVGDLWAEESALIDSSLSRLASFGRVHLVVLCSALGQTVHCAAIKTLAVPRPGHDPATAMNRPSTRGSGTHRWTRSG